MRLVAALAMALLSMAYLRHFLNGGPELLAKASLTSCAGASSSVV